MAGEKRVYVSRTDFLSGMGSPTDHGVQAKFIGQLYIDLLDTILYYSNDVGNNWIKIRQDSNVAWSNITGIPTTLVGYGITDAYDRDTIDGLLDDLKLYVEEMFAKKDHEHETMNNEEVKEIIDNL